MKKQNLNQDQYMEYQKLFAHQLVINYREAYNLYLSNGILFNHESPRRGETFCIKKS